MHDILPWLGLVLLGIGVGSYGTMIGAGGGFVLVPVLLLLFPDESPELITSISLATVFFNALSGTIAYARQGRIDYYAANIFAAATIPGAIAGALAVAYVPRDLFDLIFAFVLLAIAAFLLARPIGRIVQRSHRRGEITRTHTDKHGDTYLYSYNVRTGIVISILVGFLSSLLGIGGGIIHVPAMIQLLYFPAHIATATSHYVLTISALTGTLVHVFSGEMAGGYERTAALAAGVIVGAQVGAKLSSRLQGPLIVRLLALALIAVAFRLLLTAFGI